MKNKIMMKKYSLILILLIFLAVMLESFTYTLFGINEVNLGIKIVLTFFIFICAGMAAYKELGNIILCLFYICLFNFQFNWLFFGFLFDQQYWNVYDYFGMSFNYSFSEINDVLSYLLISIVTVFFISYKYKNLSNQYVYKVDPNNMKLQNVCYYLTLISFPFAFYVMYIQVSYVITYGYQAYFLRTESFDYGFIADQMETLYRVVFAIFLATIPDAKKLRVPLFLYIIYVFMYLGTGDRTNVAILFFMLIWYFYERSNMTGSSNSVKINLKKRILLVVSGMALAFIFSIWNAIRYSFGTGNNLLNSGDLVNDSPGIIEFFMSQGRSFITVMTAESINESQLLTLEYKVYLFFQPIISQLYNSALSIVGLTKDSVSISGYQFSIIPSSADLLSYYANSTVYLGGGGLGSSFIAEGVLMAGTLGVIFTSIIVGITINFLYYNSKQYIWIRAFTCFAFIFLMRFPRDLTLGPLAFAIPFAIRAFAIYLFALVTAKKSRTS